MELRSKIKLFITIIISSSTLSSSYAQDDKHRMFNDSLLVQYSGFDDLDVFFNGFSFSADIYSPARRFFSDYIGVEGSLKVKLRNTFYPTVEIGYDICDHEDGNTHIKYKTSAPYFKVGIDYNLLKDKQQSNTFFVGLRYGLSKFNFDISGPEVTDPIWHISEPFSYNDISTTSQWLEVVSGVQVKIWRNIHLGWSVRYKLHLNSSKNDLAEPYYIPGYGTTVNSSTWGATYSVIFDLNCGKKRKTIKPY